MKTMTKLFFSLAFGSVAFVSVQAGSLEPPPGPVSATHPPDRCFDNGNRFVDCGNGTVKDIDTGLFWLKNANCFGLQSWATANISAAGLGDGQCGLTDGSLPGDWRLPALTCDSRFCQPIETATGEFASIFDSSVCKTAPYVLNATGTACSTVAPASPFSGVQSSYYWLSTTRANVPGEACYAYLDFGAVNYSSKALSYFVWPVRGGRLTDFGSWVLSGGAGGVSERP